MGAMSGVLFFIGFLIIMLPLPWVLARESRDRDDRVEEGSSGRPTTRSLLSSDRERRLWLWTLVVLLVIYSTLGLVPRVASVLRELNLLEVSSVAVLLLVGVAVATRWARGSPGRREIGVALGLTAVAIMTLSRATIPERTHLFEYGVVAILIHQALSERRRNGRRVPLPALLAVVATALLGLLDEGIQSLLPSRVYDINDVGVNALAGLAAVVASLAMRWARSRDRRWVRD